MAEVGIHTARRTLTQLIERAEAGEEIVITRHGKPVARLVRTSSFASLRGALRGRSTWRMTSTSCPTTSRRRSALVEAAARYARRCVASQRRRSPGRCSEAPAVRRRQPDPAKAQRRVGDRGHAILGQAGGGGRLPLASPPRGALALPISVEHAAACERLRGHHHDQFDRILVPQAAVKPPRALRVMSRGARTGFPVFW